MPHWLVEIRRFDLPSRATLWTILLVRKNIRRKQDKGKLRNIYEKVATALNVL